jgi:3-oxoacyl-[acyl-carrier-protein] synthase-3
MVYYPVGISSLAVSFPKIIRTNDYWQENFPELIPQTHSKRVKRSPRFTKSTYELNELDIWSQEVAPYL